MGFFKKNKTHSITSAVDGVCVPLEDVKDEMFASKMMGEGIAFVSNDGMIYSPIDGEITMIAKSKHAFGITSKDGFEILLHVGLDTVNLNGVGLEVLCNVNDNVKCGSALLQLDMKYMQENNIDITTPCIFLNGSEYKIDVHNVIGSVIKETLIATYE